MGNNGWAPPPKPGLIPLRPLGFGTLLSAPFQVLRRNPKAAFGSGLIIQGLSLLLSAALTGLIMWIAFSRLAFSEASDRDTMTAGSVASIVLSVLVPLALSLIGTALLQGVIVLEVARGTLGERLRLGSLWRLARGRLVLLVGWVLLVGAGILVAVLAVTAVVWALVVNGPAMLVIGILVAVFGGLAMVAGFIWLGTKLSLVPSSIVLERLGIAAAIARSWSLTNGFFWRTFAIQALIALILQVVTQIVVTPLTLVFGFSTALLDPNGQGDGVVAGVILYGVIVLVTLVIGAIAAVVQAAATALIYIDLRMRKEGLDLQLTRFVEARESGAELPDPYLPPSSAPPESRQAGSQQAGFGPSASGNGSDWA